MRLKAAWADARVWCIGGGVAVLLHAGAVGAVIFFRSAGSAASAAPSRTAFAIELAMMPTAPAARPTEVAAGPPRVESLKARVAPKVVVKMPPIVAPPLSNDAPTDAVTVAQKEPPTPEERVAPDRTELQTSAPPPQAAPPLDDKPKAAVLGTSSQPSADAKQTWESRILAHLEQRKRYPYMAQRAGQQDTVYVKFVLDRRGQVLNCVIQSSRGFPTLDREALNLIERASPLPPPPPEIEGERFTQVVPIEYFVSRLN